MPLTENNRSFTLEDIQQSARYILNILPARILAYRLMFEVLSNPGRDPELLRVKEAALSTKWIQQLYSTQLPDGS